jgi:hypothetical protein
VEIKTERLVLREIRTDDWPAVLEYQRDPRYLRYYATAAKPTYAHSSTC